MSELRKELERRIKAEAWEADEDIITVDGVPIGMTLSRRDSRVVRDWLCGAWGDLTRIFAHTPPAGERGEREALGRLVRETWVNYCREMGDTKPSHVAPWDDLSEWDKEADRRIGEAVALAHTPPAGERGERAAMDLWRALANLIALKDLKDTNGKVPLYTENQPKAWEQAREAAKRWESFKPWPPTLDADPRPAPTMPEPAGGRTYYLCSMCKRDYAYCECPNPIRDAIDHALDRVVTHAPTPESGAVKHEPMNHMGNDGWQVRCRECLAMWPCEKPTPPGGSGAGVGADPWAALERLIEWAEGAIEDGKAGMPFCMLCQGVDRKHHEDCPEPMARQALSARPGAATPTEGDDR